MKQAKLVYIDFNQVLYKIVIIILTILTVYCLWDWNQIFSVEIGSEDRSAKYIIEGRDQIQEVTKLLKDAKPSLKRLDGSDVYYLKMRSKRKTETIYFNSEGNTMVIDGQGFRVGHKLRQYLCQSVKQINQLSPYGELVPWIQVNQLLEFGIITTVHDLETGKAFKVKRIGGVGHADMEPITETDTKVIKELYGGVWSWKRRAVIIRQNGLKLAASMNGMPHDQDDNPNNGIKGHFCMYFFQSQHPKGKDLAHELMVQKAAGRIKSMLNSVADKELIYIFITALDQGDYSLISQISGGSRSVERLRKKQIISCTIKKIQLINKDQFRVDLQLSYKDGPYNKIKQVDIAINRNHEKSIRIAEAVLQQI